MKRTTDLLIDAGAGTGGGFQDPDACPRVQATRNGVEYLGSYVEQRVALFRDPLTGSSFAVRDGEAIEAGISRVRTRFGLS